MCEDVADKYVSIERALKDYGIVISAIDEDMTEYQGNEAVTETERACIRGAGKDWLGEDPEDVARRFRASEPDTFDPVRQYGVIADWGTGGLMPGTTTTCLAMIERRTAAHWA